MNLKLTTLVLLGAIASPSIADDTLQACKQRLEAQALEQGVNQQTISQEIADLEPLKRVVKHDRNQAEFVSTFADYYQARVTDWRIKKGQELLQKYDTFLDKLTKQYGIPAPYLVSFWGMETNFGSYKGNISTMGALLTLACDQRRSSYFSKELINALKLIEREDLDSSKMVGSWAGAMGHTQFMPTTYLNYAVDGDGDGKINLWESDFDALASAANFLSELGWTKELRWGREVILPEGHDFESLGLAQKQPLKYWRNKGVMDRWGNLVVNADVDGALLLPMGADGPAFLVYDNFKIIKRWNNSNSYALSVALLADQIRGLRPLKSDFPSQKKQERSTLIALQELLIERGYLEGKADGIIGTKSREAIRQLQRENSLAADGYPSESLLRKLDLLADNKS